VHGILRDILARYLDQKPQELRFRHGPSGKPFLDADGRAHHLHFNLSHSHEFALYAVAYDLEVGIDVERLEPNLADEEIAKRFFSRQQLDDLHARPAALLTRTFFELWTAQEAYLKARGEGLSDRRSIPVPPVDASGSGMNRGWMLYSLAVDPSYVAALVAQGEDWRPTLWQWRM
jgi:4'-phosphopantetheinyl transferase